MLHSTGLQPWLSAAQSHTATLQPDSARQLQSAARHSVTCAMLCCGLTAPVRLVACCRVDLLAAHSLCVQPDSTCGVQFAATACTIVSGAIAERARFEAYILYSFFMAAWVYPILTHSGASPCLSKCCSCLASAACVQQSLLQPVQGVACSVARLSS